MPVIISNTKDQLMKEAPELYVFTMRYCSANGFKPSKHPRFRESSTGRFAFTVGNQQAVSIPLDQMTPTARSEFRLLVARHKNDANNPTVTAPDVPYQRFRKFYPEFCKCVDNKIREPLKMYTSAVGGMPDEILVRRFTKKKLQVFASKDGKLTSLTIIAKVDMSNEARMQFGNMQAAMSSGTIEKMELTDELIHALNFDDWCAVVRSHIKKRLALSDKVFSVTVVNSAVGIHLAVKISSYSTILSTVLDLETLKEKKDDFNALKEYFIGAADEFVKRMQAHQNEWESGLKLEYIKKNKNQEYKSIVIEFVNKCLDEKKLSAVGITWNVEYRDLTLIVKFLHRGVPFKCILSKNRGSSVTNILDDIVNPSWLVPFVKSTIKEENGTPIKKYTLDVESAARSKLEALIPKLSDVFDKVKLKADVELVLPNELALLKTELEDCEIKYRTWNIPYIDGNINTLKKGTFASASLCLRLCAPYLTLENAIGIWYLDDKRIKKEWNAIYQTFLNNNSSKLIERCRTYAKEAFAPYSKIECENSSVGILYGDTTFDICCKGLTLQKYEYKTPLYRDSVTEWRRALNKNIKAIEKAFSELEEKRFLAFCDRYKLWLDSYLVRDIMDFIDKNERYITENAVVQALRGLCIALDTGITVTSGCGKYVFFENDLIKDYIEELIDNRYLTTKTLKGTYGHFDILKIDPIFRANLKRLIDISEQNEADCSEKRIKEIGLKFQKGQRVSDPEVKIYLQDIISHHRLDDLESSAYMSLLSVTDRYYILEVYADTIKECFMNAPDAIKQYIDMKYSQATPKEKKIFKRFFKK